MSVQFDLKKSFRSLVDSSPINEERLSSAVKDMAFEVERRAKLRAPVDHGRLRASIEAGVDSEGAFVKAQTEYAAFVEFGTMTVGRQTDPGPTPAWYQHSARPGGVTSRPFLRPAFYEVAGEAAEVLRRHSKR